MENKFKAPSEIATAVLCYLDGSDSPSQDGCQDYVTSELGRSMTLPELEVFTEWYQREAK